MQIVMLWKLNISYVTKTKQNKTKQNKTKNPKTNKQTKTIKQANKQTNKKSKKAVSQKDLSTPAICFWNLTSLRFLTIYFSSYSNSPFFFEEKEKRK